MHHPQPLIPGSSQAEPNDSIVVIAPQYCKPYQVDFHIAKKVGYITEDNNLAAFDINGKKIFKVTTKYFKRYRVLVDAAGVPLVSLKQKNYASSRWNAYRGDSENSKDLLFSVKKTRFLGFLAFKTNLDVLLVSNTNEGVCDFKIIQKCSEKSCFIYRGNSGNLIATMHKQKTVRGKVLGKGTFLVTVCPNVDYAFVMALRVALDEITGSGGDDRDEGDSTTAVGGGCGG
ncbi:hypothetical protein MKX01_029874 [Papaver californicum]|nr:hypothetical protein MKX01_029874 [Papaver californicum]